MEMRHAPLRPLRAIIFALLAAALIKLCIIDFMLARGSSMLPTIPDGTVLAVNRAAYGLRFPFQSGYLLRWKKPQTGDIVVFTSSNGHLAVKRCGERRGDWVEVLGDNAAESWDSRAYGPIPDEAILGKVMGIE